MAGGCYTSSDASIAPDDELEALERRIDEFDEQFASDYGAIMRTLAAARYLHRSALSAVKEYRKRRDKAASVHADFVKKLGIEPEHPTGSQREERKPSYAKLVASGSARRSAENVNAWEQRLATVEQRAIERGREAAVFEEVLDRLKRERVGTRRALLAQRVSLLDSPVRRKIPTPAVPHYIDELLDDLPEFLGTAAAGRECQRCGVEIPVGRRRFCSRDCRTLYIEENGTSDNPKRSRFYDYGTDDLENERWDESCRLDVLEE